MSSAEAASGVSGKYVLLRGRRQGGQPRAPRVEAGQLREQQEPGEDGRVLGRRLDDL